MTIRQARPDDHDAIVAVVDEWWGRPIAEKLPRLFLDHFYLTSLVAEDQHGLGGFLVGFLSPSALDEAYIHFVGVRPDLRSAGLAKDLYLRFFAIARSGNRSVVRAITSLGNIGSIGFHERMGFTVDLPEPGGHPVRFTLALPS